MTIEPWTRANRLYRLPLVASAAALFGILPAHAQDVPACQPRLAAGDECRETFDFGGYKDRSFIVHVPRRYADQTAAVPLLVDLHGHTGTSEKQRDTSGQREQSDRLGFVAVWPQGLKRRWNSRPELDLHQDDVAFLREVIARVGKQVRIDARRIYVTGHSNGGADVTVAYRRPYDYKEPQERDASYHGPVTKPHSGAMAELDSLKKWGDIDRCDTSRAPAREAIGQTRSYVLSYSGCAPDPFSGKPVQVRPVTILDAPHGTYLSEQAHNADRVDIAGYIWDHVFDAR